MATSCPCRPQGIVRGCPHHAPVALKHLISMCKSASVSGRVDNGSVCSRDYARTTHVSRKNQHTHQKHTKKNTQQKGLQAMRKTGLSRQYHPQKPGSAWVGVARTNSSYPKCPNHHFCQSIQNTKRNKTKNERRTRPGARLTNALVPTSESRKVCSVVFAAPSFGQIAMVAGQLISWLSACSHD